MDFQSLIILSVDYLFWETVKFLSEPVSELIDFLKWRKLTENNENYQDKVTIINDLFDI